MVTVEEALAARERARSDAENALVQWRSEVGAELRDFLTTEATITAKTQHEVTLKLGENVQTFKAQTTQAAEAAASALARWAATLTVDQILTMPGNLHEALQSEAADVIEPWADLFRDAGFNPGTLQGFDYQRGRKTHPWTFYNPSTGTARSERIPTGASFQRLIDAMGRYSSAINGVKAAEKARDVQAAADLWDS